MLPPTLSPSHAQCDISNSDQPDSSDDSDSSKMEGNSETHGKSQDKMSTKSIESTGTSVATLRTADEEGNEREINDSQP